MKRGYRVDESVRDDGRRYVTYTSPSGKQWQTRAARIAYPCVSKEAAYTSLNKEVAYKFAHDHGVSIPATRYVKSNETLSDTEVSQMLATHTALIVKPSNASLSRGLTLKIRTSKALHAALTRARKVSPTVLIQEQVEGEEIRFVVMDGIVVSALLRQTARVVGDGVLTVAQLIERENEIRRELVFEHLTYPQLTEEIVPAEFFTSLHIPKKGEVVELNRATMIRNGCSVYDVIDEIDSSYRQLVEDLCRHMDTKFIVVDMFIRDYAQPRAKGNHWFIEFNAAPVLKLFYGCRNGKMFDIVPQLVKSIDATLHTPATHERMIVGGFEEVTLPDYDDGVMVAKIDTGAYSGALYATRVRKKVDEAGRDYVTFALLGDQTKICTSYDFYQRSVRSAHGHTQQRYVIRTHVRIKGKLYETEIGLSDRSNMKFPILIGRKFLREYDMLVDVTRNEEMDHEKELLG